MHREDREARAAGGSVLAVVATTALASGSVPLGYVVVMLTAAATLLDEATRARPAVAGPGAD